MDKKRNIELENWLIETTGEEMMANHLGPNWNRFHEECGFYPNISMTIADQVWEHKQKQIDELRAEIRKLIEEYKSEEKELELKEWEQSTIYGRIAIELEEALKGGEV